MRTELMQMERMTTEERFGAQAGQLARLREDIRRRMRREREEQQEETEEATPGKARETESNTNHGGKKHEYLRD